MILSIMLPVNQSPTSSPAPIPVPPPIMATSPNPAFTTQPYHRERTTESSHTDPEYTKQRLQANQEILNLLSKINLSNKLTNHNYMSWSQAVTISLRSIDLDKYLITDSPTSEIFSPLYHKTIKRLLSSWIFSQLESYNVAWLNSKSSSLPELAACKNLWPFGPPWRNSAPKMPAEIFSTSTNNLIHLNKAQQPASENTLTSSRWSNCKSYKPGEQLTRSLGLFTHYLNLSTPGSIAISNPFPGFCNCSHITRCLKSFSRHMNVPHFYPTPRM